MMSWKFVNYVLQDVGIPGKIRKIMMESISFMKINVFWKGKRRDYFSIKKGLRQGDPISLYLFFLCMDQLSHLTSEIARQSK